MENVTLSKEVLKAITNNSYYDEGLFLSDAKSWIKAIKEGRVVCSVVSVSRTGMSRKLKFLSYELNLTKGEKGYYRQFNSMLECLGYKVKDYSITVNGCGMDMIFNTNYNIMHAFKHMGIITKEECSVLSQSTPTTI